MTVRRNFLLGMPMLLLLARRARAQRAPQAGEQRSGGTGATVHAINGGPVAQHYGYFPYINVAKSRFVDWNSSGAMTLDANDDLATLAAGARAWIHVWGTLHHELHAVHAGSYVIKWDGSDLPLSVTCAGSSRLARVSARRWTVTIPPLSATDSRLFRCTWLNDTTSAAVTVRNLRICLASHEAALDAGRISHPEWAAFVNSPAFYRPMKPMLIENSTVSLASHCRSEESHGWGSSKNPPDKTGLPYSAAAKIAVELGCDLVAILPIRVTSQSEMNAIAAQIHGVSSFARSSLKIIAEVGNENWNTGYSGFAFLNKTYGPTQTSATYPSGLTAPQAEAKLCLMWCRALEDAGFARDRIVRSISLQAGGSWHVGGYADLALKYIDEGNILGSGGRQRCFELIDQVNTAAYASIATPKEDLYHARIKNIDWVNLSDSQVDAYYDNGIAIAAARLASMYAYLAALRPGLRRTTYEFGQGALSVTPGFIGTGYEFTINASDNTAVWTHRYTYQETPQFTDGDRWVLCRGGLRGAGGYASTGYKPGTVLYIKKKSASEAWFFASDQARLADVGNTGAGSIPLDDATPANSPYWCDNITRSTQFIERIHAYLDSAAGRAFYQRLVASQIGPGKLREACHLYDVAGYSKYPLYGSAWGLKRGVAAPDTPRSLWFLAQ